jgi:hypothetical protein
MVASTQTPEDAKFIAAAPELLEALKEVKKRMIDFVGMEDNAPTITIINKAIAKAEVERLRAIEKEAHDKRVDEENKRLEEIAENLRQQREKDAQEAEARKAAQAKEDCIRNAAPQLLKACIGAYKYFDTLDSDKKKALGSHYKPVLHWIKEAIATAQNTTLIGDEKILDLKGE